MYSLEKKNPLMSHKMPLTCIVHKDGELPLLEVWIMRYIQILGEKNQQ